MADNGCERCRMIRFYLVWTILMSLLMYLYLRTL